MENNFASIGAGSESGLPVVSAPKPRKEVGVELSNVNRIFVRAPNWVGDFVMASGAFARLRAAFPDAYITCGLRPYLCPLLSGSPYFDSVLEMPKARGRGAMGAFRAQVQELREGEYDLAVILPNSQATGWIARLAGIPLRLGYKQGRPLTMNLGLRAVRNKDRGLIRRHGPKRIPKPMPSYYEDLLDVLELPPTPAGAGLHTNDEERAWIKTWLREQGVAAGASYVILNPGASFGPSKLWVNESWAGLARHYLSVGMIPILTAGPNEVDLVHEIAAMASGVVVTDPIIPLDKLKALLESASLVVSTDTGPRHLAVGMHVPTVCLMGPNDRRYTDYALDRQIVLQKDLPCVPCQKKVCPLGHQDCMRTMTVQEVIQAGDSLLSR